MSATALARRSALEGVLREGFASGSFAALAAWHAPDALLESWVGGACRQVRGSGAMIEHLEGAWDGPAGLSHWRMVESPGGCEVEVQRPHGGEPGLELAEHHLLHLDGEGRVALHLVYPAPTRGATDDHREAVAALLGGVERLEVLRAGTSGGSAYRAHLADGSTRVVKHMAPGGDWLMRATRDRGREGLLWQAGFFQALPPGLSVPILSAHELDDGWLVIMRDVEPALRAFHRDPTAHAPAVIEAAVALHAMPLPADPSVLCTMADRLRMFSPLRPYVEWRRRDTIPKTLTRMWQTFAELPATEVVDAVFACVNDPGPLLARLERHPQRLLHGDLRLPNLGRDGEAVVLLDWALACLGPAELEAVAFACDASFWCGLEPDELVARWAQVSGTPLDAEALDLAFVYQAAMGELAFLAHELAQRPEGVTRLSPERLAWWTTRVGNALERVGL
jgi:hypothetical protein